MAETNNAPQLDLLPVGEGESLRNIAVLHRAGRNEQAPQLVWLGGYRSDMSGTKAVDMDKLAAEHGGFRRKELENIIVSAEASQGVDVVLDPRELTDVINITAESSKTLETENANVSRALSTQARTTCAAAG